MESIVRGTTPTIKFTFSSVQVSDIEVAYLVIKIAGKVVVEKDITTAEVGDNYISWTLEQENSLDFYVGYAATVYCDWRTFTGTRGRSSVGRYMIEETGKNEVI